MKIKITGKVDGFETGLIYDVPDKQAKKLIKEDVAISLEKKSELEGEA